MRNKFFTLLFAILASSALSYAAIVDGICGDNLTWSLNTEDSTLTIEGSGEMDDWASAGVLPWYEIRSNVAYVNLPIGLTKIGKCAFNGFENLTTLEIPQNVAKIGNYAFSWSYKLVSIIVDPNNLTYCSVDGVLFNKKKTQLIKYPEGKTGTSYTIINSIESIEENAFFNSQHLDSITIPGSVTNIGRDAFQKSSLTKVNIINLAAWCTKNYDGWGYSDYNIYYDLYLNGDLVTNIRIPESVTSLGKFAFSQCKSITSVSIPSNVATIGYGIFFFSEYITEIYNYAAIPQSITTASFYEVDKSTCVLYVPEESIDLYQEAEGWSAFENIVAIPDTEPETEEVNCNIRYIDKNSALVSSEQLTFNVPEAPEIEGFTFVRWEFVGGAMSEGLTIQAVYQANTPTSAPEVYTNPSNPAQKLIREGNVYILKGEKTYTIQGQEVR